MGKLFGTDGIRGIANEDPITPEMGVKLGKAVVVFCRRRGIHPLVVIGRDTRLSGKMLQSAIVSGILSGGGDVRPVDEMPTPGVAYLTRVLWAGAGIVVSASHNPHEYNGFKVFSGEGYKLTEEEEAEIEELLLSQSFAGPADRPPVGCEKGMDGAGERYRAFLKNAFPVDLIPVGLKVVLDCSNGATSKVAPPLFSEIGATTDVLFAAPDGKNINRDCGSQHTETLSRAVLEKGADVGLAFDGDGDRLIAVDERGRLLTGDQILIILASMLKEEGKLKQDVVVSTVMSNIGFRVALAALGVEQVVTAVGDRHVLEEMRRRGAVLGGEDSGHIILLEHHTTGDGLLSALQLLAAMRRHNRPLSQLSRLMTVFPQVLVNVPVRRKPDISAVPPVAQAIESVEQVLGRKGRVLVRYSGTEPLCRVMVEGEVEEEVRRHAEKIAKTVEENLG